MLTIKLHDINLYYETYGEGEPLVLIQGLGLDSSAWINQTPTLSQKYQVILFDNRGIGRTDTPKSSYELLVTLLLAILACPNSCLIHPTIGQRPIYFAGALSNTRPTKICYLWRVV